MCKLQNINFYKIGPRKKLQKCYFKFRLALFELATSGLASSNKKNSGMVKKNFLPSTYNQNLKGGPLTVNRLLENLNISFMIRQSNKLISLEF